ncbi:MAG: hypothetical protein ACE15C_14615 [Phycisphaerae bacterium]
MSTLDDLVIETFLTTGDKYVAEVRALDTGKVLFRSLPRGVEISAYDLAMAFIRSLVVEACERAGLPAIRLGPAEKARPAAKNPAVGKC